MTKRCDALDGRCLLPAGHPALVGGDPDDPLARVERPHLDVPADLAGVLVPIDELTPHPRNPRRGDVGAIVLALVRFGVLRAAIVQESTGFMAAGNHTWMAGKALGAIAWPRTRVDLSDVEAAAYLIADNRLHDVGSYDDDALAAVLSDLARQGELAAIGYDGEDVEDLLRRLAADGEGLSFDERMGEWKGMPEFNQPDVGAVAAIKVNFRTEEDAAAFAELVGQARSSWGRSIWYPKAEIGRLATKRYATG